ncbi:PH domain-containing protein [Anaerococcus sp. NML200574]|uniref:PH domain-containing protein n=1 Tax=unclassified Anaerococcus TaxID=2614126 RepID=UPI000D0B1C7D|nr:MULTISPECIES: PH domain-containing protein [unclassified Anaerococcus]MCW6679446.1 PH domain-containing protein [Anaerococcus sp. NML200574]
MATISTGLWGDSNTFNLKEIDSSKVRSELLDFFVDGEEIISAFETIRDQVVFSNKRILVVNVQGITGKKRAYISYPYSKIQYFGVETAGVLDIDSELFLAFNDGKSLSFDFKTSVDIVSISKVISSYVL